MDITKIHTPVLLERTLEILEPALRLPDAVYVDATLGMGGHAEAVLRTHSHVRVLGIDRDDQALGIAKQRLAAFGERVVFVRAVYDDVASAWRQSGLPRPTAILFDLGVSSLQLDDAARGFAYAQDAPLDMRMSTHDDVTAADIISTYDEEELRRIFSDYGEERLAERYARAIVAERAQSPIVRSQDLVAVLQRATPAALKDKGHPAKRVFQALRIEVNRELAALADALPQALDLLVAGGRIVVLSYHSLEDRLVKRIFAERARDVVPRGVPVVPEHMRPELRLLTRGAESASDKERTENPRSASVKLRAAERLREAA